MKKALKDVSMQWRKPILFTEYGYRSMPSTTYKTWEKEDQVQPVDVKEQVNAYTAIYESFWNEKWFGGGFLWKWICADQTAGGATNSFYTPQHKPVEKVIRVTYSKN